MVRRLVLLVLAVALTACSGPSQPTPDVAATPEVPAHTRWALSHSIKESASIRVTGGTIGHYSDATSLHLGQDADGLDVTCSVTVSVAGQGGPENMVGEKVPVTVNGQPGFRNGAGAEVAI